MASRRQQDQAAVQRWRAIEGTIKYHGHRYRAGSIGGNRLMYCRVLTEERVLAHVHTLNDIDVIDGIIDALRRQTRPIDCILVVDNGSTDGTLNRPSLRYATVIREPVNLGTSGAVETGIKFALDHGYDWVWLFDADSIPEPDALEKLLDLYAGWSIARREKTAFLACLYFDIEDGIARHGGIFTHDGIDHVRPAVESRYYQCHFTIWSGCLYRLAAVNKIGLPNQDYVLDWGEGEYGYRIMMAGYEGFIAQDARLHHNVGGKSFDLRQVKLGPLRFTTLKAPPIRCYYGCRNMLYFLLYEVRRRQPKMIVRTFLGVARQMVNYLLEPRCHREHLRACLRGFWHGVTGNIAARY